MLRIKRRKGMEQYRSTRFTNKEKHIGELALISKLQNTWDIRVIDDLYNRNISVAGGICVVIMKARSDLIVYIWYIRGYLLYRI